MRMPGMSYVGSGIQQNKYLYNGKELKDESSGGNQLNWYRQLRDFLSLRFCFARAPKTKASGEYDYGFRNYDPVIGRWHSVDPLAENNYSISPYVYVENNPMRYIDPDGREKDEYSTSAALWDTHLYFMDGGPGGSGGGGGSSFWSSSYMNNHVGHWTDSYTGLGPCGPTSEDYDYWSDNAASELYPNFMDWVNAGMPMVIAHELYQNEVTRENLMSVNYQESGVPYYVAHVLKEIRNGLAQNREEAVSYREFYLRYAKSSYWQMITESGFSDGLPAGPDFRYIQDPLHPNVVIDMRHFLMIGAIGNVNGFRVEVLQYIAGRPSGMNLQDFYSNFLGSVFYRFYFNPLSTLPLIKQVYNFFNDYANQKILIYE